jgi:hypothetical protein
MPAIEIGRAGNVSVADQMAEMHAWLREQAIQPLELQPVRIVKASVRFLGKFATQEDAERFRLRFDEESVASRA